jgi:hypothetical protein
MIVAGVLPYAAPALLLRAARAGIAYLEAGGHLHQPGSVYEHRLASYLVEARWTALRRLALPGTCWIAFAVAVTRGHRQLAVVAAVVEVIAFGIGYNPAIRTGEIAPKPAAIVWLDERDPARRWLMASAGGLIPPNVATSYRLRDAVPYDILTSEEWTRRLLPAGYDPTTCRLPAVLSADQRRALSDLGVRWLVTPVGVEELPDARLVAIPPNDPPAGLPAGIAVSLGGLLLAIVVLGRCDRRS